MAFFLAAKNLCKKFKQNSKDTLTHYPVQQAKTQYICYKDPQSDLNKQRTPLIIPSLSLQGSITVEASLLLPLFLIFFLNIISVLQFLSCYGRIEAALHQTARNLSVYAYLYQREENTIEETNTEAYELLSGACSIVYARADTERRLGKDYLEHSPIVGKAGGIQYAYSSVMKEDHCIDLVAVYQVRPMLALPQILDIRLMNRCRVRAWTGYAQENATGNTEQEVYVTEHGSVYHLSAMCTHLRLSVKQVLLDQVKGLRNANGAKYYECEICGKQKRQGNLCYITGQGNRYHHTISCSGLKRSVQPMPISKVGNLPPCSRCG